MNRIVKGWNRLFDSPVDTRVYAAVRFAIGGILAIYAFVLGPDFVRWFAEEGVLGRAELARNIDLDTWSILNWLPGTEGALRALFLVFCVQLLLFLIGLGTRFQAICLFLWILSLHHRNNLVWEGGDVLLRVSLLLLIFMPLGARWSVDAFLRKRTRNQSPVWPLRLLQLQQSILYLSSVGQKLQGSDWVRGEALFYIGKLDDFSGRLGPYLLPEEWSWGFRIGTWMVIAVEILIGIGVWIPSIRNKVVIIGILFHVSIELTMNLFVFQWLMILILATHLATPLHPAGTGDSNGD